MDSHLHSDTTSEVCEVREEDAKTKWCPLKQVAMQIGWKNSDIKQANCIASDCMMWVWDEAFNEPAGTPGTNWDTEGHCGLVK